jgi:uncharacterized membrane protein YeaQ/YmgE (transglycosylase-associated protein family)
MTIETLLVILFIGAIAGWLAGVIMKGGGFGLLGHIVVGIVGAFVGSFVLGRLLGVSLGGGILASICTALIGAIIVLALIRLIKRV